MKLGRVVDKVASDWLFGSVRLAKAFDRPIFILSAPRSGSTFLFELLCRASEVWAWTVEMDEIWERYFPCSRLDEPSDLVSDLDYTPEQKARVQREFYRLARWGRQERGWPVGLADRLAWHPIRYLDKTTANCFHLKFIKRAFPDALYLVLHRDGRAVISSMMEGWNEPHFIETLLATHIEKRGNPSFHWSFSTPPGWTEQIGRPLEEVCAWSWVQHTETILQELVDLDSGRIRVIKYEELVEETSEVIQDAYKFCDLDWSVKAERYMRENPLSRTTVSHPNLLKWRQRHGAFIEHVLPHIEPTMCRIGYIP